jgi:hypothetical protein
MLPLLALLAACDRVPYHGGHAVSAVPPDITGSLGAPVAMAPAPDPPLSGSTVPPPLPMRMSAPELARTFADNTAKGISSSGIPYAAYFAGDGSERFRAGSVMDVGRWRVSADDRLCTSLATLGSGESCYMMYRSGSTITFGAPDGTAIGSVTVVSGNPMSL